MILQIQQPMLSEQRNIRKKLTLYGVCCFTLAGIYCTGLWPFNFFPKNNVLWLKDTRGISFGAYGIAYTQKNIELKSLFPDKRLTITAVLRAEGESENGLIRILSFYPAGNFNELFFIGQWRSHLIVRVWKTDLRQDKPYQEIGVNYALKVNKPMHLVITTNPESGTVVYVNGAVAEERKKFFLFADTGVSDVRLFVGGSAMGDKPFNGSVMALNLYNRVFSAQEAFLNYDFWTKTKGMFPEKAPVLQYCFAEKSGAVALDSSGNNNPLVIPEIFKAPHKTMVFKTTGTYGMNHADRIDIFINILGFVPLGFFFALFFSLKKKTSVPMVYGKTILAGFAIGLSIETLQLCLPDRCSTILDGILNTLGTLAGVMLLHFSFYFDETVFCKKK